MPRCMFPLSAVRASAGAMALLLMLVAGCKAPPSTTAADAQPAQAPPKPLDVPNVVRDPADVPAPIRRTSPTTVEITLTVREVVSELADSVTYGFWTFDGTVPGPMLRVMEGDLVKLTLVNPASSKVPHNIDLHAVNGPAAAPR